MKSNLSRKIDELIENLKSAILSNIIVKIRNRDTKELLWCCYTGECYGEFKKYEEKLEIEQDIDLTGILRELKKFTE